MGNCLAGDTCAFSHDPSSLVSKLSLEDNSMYSGSPPTNHVLPDFQIQDYNSFPALQQIPLNQWTAAYGQQQLDGPSSYGGQHLFAGSPASFGGQSSFLDAVPPRRPRSRPNSRHSRAATPSIPSVDDPEAFPTLGSAGTGNGKKQVGKRGGGPREKDSTPNTLAGIVRMAPSPSPGNSRPTSKAGNRSVANNRENSAAAQAIPAPRHIPWLETGEKANKAYLKARQEAIRHGQLRNKFLQRWV